MDRAECPWHAPSRRDNCRGSTDYGSRASHDVDARAEYRTGEGDVRASAEIGARGGNRVRLRHLPTSPTSACVRMLFLPHVVAVRPSGLMVHQAKELAGPVAIALVVESPVANGGLPQNHSDISLEDTLDLRTNFLSAGPASNEQIEEQWLTY